MAALLPAEALTIFTLPGPTVPSGRMENASVTAMSLASLITSITQQRCTASAKSAA